MPVGSKAFSAIRAFAPFIFPPLPGSGPLQFQTLKESINPTNCQGLDRKISRIR
jgi:hypothetical protein